MGLITALPERMASDKLRQAIAFEAARLMYERLESEYFTAKRKAAKRLCRHGCKPEDLPSNSEIRDQIQVFARVHEGDRRWRVAHCRPRPQTPTSTKYTEINYPFYDSRHGDGATLLFSDGHAKWRKKAAILLSEFGLKPKVPNETMEQVGANDVRDIAF